LGVFFEHYTPLHDLLQHLVKKNPNIAGKSRQIWDVKGKKKAANRHSWPDDR
jgi:hypothetical protein